MAATLYSRPSMLPQLLSITGPLMVYLSLAVLLYGIWQARQHGDVLALAPAAAGLLASALLLSPVHRLFFDEDIYVNIAQNLSHAPVNQVTVWGAPGDIRVSTYYKEPPGWPVVLSLAFLISGPSEGAAFSVARILYALSIAAVYHLALAVLGSRPKALLAAILFGATPICFWFSASAGTDIAAALFSTLGLWGLVLGNGPLAAAGLALAADTRMELLVFVPLVWLSPRIPMKWKITAAALVAVEFVHVPWVFSLAPVLARVEGVPSAFSRRYVAPNLTANLGYLLNLGTFPGGLAAVAAFSAITRHWGKWKDECWSIAAAACALFGVYLLFYAGSFNLNARYSLQMLAPVTVLAASFMRGRRAILVLLVLLPIAWPPQNLSAGMQSLADDHQLAVEFRARMQPTDLIVSGQPEMFLNHGARAMHAAYASTHKDTLEGEIRSRKVWYHSGVRANLPGTEEARADEWLKANFELRLVEAPKVGEVQIGFYEVSIKAARSRSRVRPVADLRH